MPSNTFHKKSNYMFKRNKTYHFNMMSHKMRSFSTLSKLYNTSSKEVLSDMRYENTLDNFIKNSLKYFPNASEDKKEMLKFMNNQSGIYMWTNKLNNKKYMGSSVDLKRRLLEYYNVNRMTKEKSMPICRALIKYDYHNFSFFILEFCKMDDLMSKELYFFEKYLPEYNTLKMPGSPSRGSGWKHSEKTMEKTRKLMEERTKSSEYLDKLVKAQSGNMEMEALDLNTNITTKYHSINEASRITNMSKRYIKHNIYINKSNPILDKYIFSTVNTNYNIEKSMNMKKVMNQKTSIKLEMTDLETKKVTIYPSVGEASRAIGTRQSSMSTYLKNKKDKPFKERYIMKII
ncbi:putative GIY-YIG endonuclease (mitochondrion) [[Candida] anglica]